MRLLESRDRLLEAVDHGRIVRLAALELQALPQAQFQLARRLLGEGDRDDFTHVRAPLTNDGENPVHELCRLARAGCRFDDDGFIDGLTDHAARIVIALSGPLVHLFLCALYLWTASLPGPGLLKAFLAASGILQMQSFFISLYPFCFLEMDGYHILVDVIGFPTLNHDSWRFVKEGLPGRIVRRERLTRAETVCLAYFVLSLVSVVGFVLLNIWVLVHAVQS